MVRFKSFNSTKTLFFLPSILFVFIISLFFFHTNSFIHYFMFIYFFFSPLKQIAIQEKKKVLDSEKLGLFLHLFLFLFLIFGSCFFFHFVFIW
jgi:hypothetical protein